MKRYLNKKFGTAFGGTLGTITCAMIVNWMVTGDFQRVVHFRGVGEEMVFTLFVLMIGVISLAMTISTLTTRE
jgi:hypothetical protein